MAGLRYSQNPFILSQKDIEENSEAIVRALRIVNAFSTTSMWARLKAEDYHNFVAGYFGNAVGRPAQWNDGFLPWGAETLKEAELWYDRCTLLQFIIDTIVNSG
jgi:hypothetical protein